MFADHGKLKKEGRSFDCSTCKVSHIRRCKEERWDFDENDSPIFPMYVFQGGDLYGFCPAKSTWDPWTVTMYKALVCAVTTGAQWNDGGLAEQPEWWVDLVSWFSGRYDLNNFHRKVVMVVGDGDKNKSQGASNNGSVKGKSYRRNRP